MFVGNLNLVIFIVVIIIILFIYLCKYLPINSDNIYLQMNGDNDKDTARRYIQMKNYSLTGGTPIDNYRMGSIYDHIFKDTQKAHNYYKKSINQLKKNKKIPETRFIQGRIANRIEINNNLEIDDNLLNIEIIRDLEEELNDLELLFNRFETELPVPSRDNRSYMTDTATPHKSKESIEKLIEWRSDSQNVHDSNINNQSTEQFNTIEQYIIQNLIYIWEYPDIIQFIRTVKLSDIDEPNREDAIHMLEYIGKYDRKIMKIGKKEKYLVQIIFSYINSRMGNQTQMENFILNLKKSYNEGTPLCIIGIFNNLLSSIADPESGIGVAKSQQVIRNEILTRAAHIRNKLVEGHPSEKDYNSGLETPEVKQLEESIMTEITKMMNEPEYSSLREKNRKEIINDIKLSI
jgi:hypothetical protein